MEQISLEQRGGASGLDRRTWNLGKITTPTLQRVHPNERLFGRLDTARAHPVTWVHGPPGAGKTTLVASYLAARGLDPLWYRLDEGDADPATFFFYLGTASRQREPDTCPALPLLTPEFRLALSLFARRFFRDLFARPNTSVVVFDDYHEVVAGVPLHECLPSGLEEVPPGCHVVIISRTPPPAQLARLRLNGRIDVVEPDALRMTPEEAKGLARERRADASADRVERISRQTQGWVAGLILMLETGAEALATPPDCAVIPEVLFDYFAGEIFQRLDPHAQRLLGTLALMPTMTVHSAAKLTDSAGAGALLEDLRKRNYFTSRDLDARYRFHPLFRDFLLQSAPKSAPCGERIALFVRAATILDEDAQPDAAVGLLTQAGAFDGLATLVKRRAAALLAEGRNDTLVAWLGKLPADQIAADAWLSYWRGAARVSVDPVGSFGPLQDAFALFQAADDVVGQFLAWAGLAEAVRLDAYGKMSRYDGLIESLRSLLARHPDFSAPAVMLPVAAGMATALSRRTSNRAEMEAWKERARVAGQALGNAAQSIRIGFAFAIVDFFDGRYAAARVALEALPDPRTLDHHPMAQWAGLMAHATALLFRQALDDLQSFAEVALERLEASGFMLWLPMIAGLASHDAIRRGDLKASGAWVRRAGAFADAISSQRSAYYDHVAALHHTASGDLATARTHAERSVAKAERNGWYFYEALARLGLASLLRESSQLDEAFAELDRLDFVLSCSMSDSIAFSAKLLRADLLFAIGDDTHGAKTLAESLAFGRIHGDTYVMLPPAQVTRLCSLALRRGIEPAFVRTLIRTYKTPPPDLYDERWPWPLRITTFGGLAIEKDGAPLTFSRKTPKRLITLLKAIAAYGGRNVPEERLIDAVWPDEEGDAAHSALNIAIHRLRKLLGDPEAVTVVGGCVSLVPGRCWLDLWAVEHLSAEASARENTDAHERLLALYRGDFLAGDRDLYWTTQRRDRMRGRFVRMVSTLADGRTTAQDHASAIALYERGLAGAPEAEEFYQGLMRCHLQRGDVAAGLAAYRRLRTVLRDGPAMAPAPASEALNRKLLAL